MKKILLSALILLLNSVPLLCQDITMEATVSANEMAVGEQFTYTISVRGSAGNLPQPQLPGMDDFRVYNAGTSSSFQFINGQVSSSVTYNYALVPLKEGEFTINPAQLNYNGKVYQTQSITVKVVPQKSQTAQQPGQQQQQQQTEPSVEERFFGQNETGELFVKTIVNKSSVYVNEPVIYSYKLYFRNVSVGQYGIQKLPDLAGFWIEDIPPDKVRKQSTEVLNGKKYYTLVLESKVLFPTAPGKKYINGARFNFVVQDFFSFFGKRIDREANPVSITILPLPDKNKPADFKGCVASLKLSTQLGSKNFIQNEPFSFKVILSGTGNIKSITDPVLPELKNFRIYDTHASLNIQKNANGVFGDKIYEYILIPEAAGKLELPAFHFTYFNYVNDGYQTLSTKPVFLNIKPGKPGSANLYTAPYAFSQSDVTLIGKDIRFIKENITAIRNEGDYFFNYGIFWFLVLLPLLGLGICFYYYQYKLKLESDVTFARASRAYRRAKKHLLEIEKCIIKRELERVPTLFEKAITGYISDKFNIPTSEIVLEQFKKVLAGKKLDREMLGLVEELYHEMNMLKYSQAAKNTPDSYRRLISRCSEMFNKIEQSVRV
ncbi:MAG: BatD family protein [bacterium]|nr:BatD family protein [bacterium]